MYCKRSLFKVSEMCHFMYENLKTGFDHVAGMFLALVLNFFIHLASLFIMNKFIGII